MENIKELRDKLYELRIQLHLERSEILRGNNSQKSLEKVEKLNEEIEEIRGRIKKILKENYKNGGDKNEENIRR